MEIRIVKQHKRHHKQRNLFGPHTTTSRIEQKEDLQVCMCAQNMKSIYDRFFQSLQNTHDCLEPFITESRLLATLLNKAIKILLDEEKMLLYQRQCRRQMLLI